MDPTKTAVPAAAVPAARRPELDGEPQVMTVDSVARVLRVNRKTVYEMVRTKGIPGVVKLGRVIRFSRDALLEWLGGRPANSTPRR
jgi:excisionase family DNA binding protein